VGYYFAFLQRAVGYWIGHGLWPRGPYHDPGDALPFGGAGEAYFGLFAMAAGVCLAVSSYLWLVPRGSNKYWILAYALVLGVAWIALGVVLLGRDPGGICRWALD
jgi:hypothetical protein